MKTRLSFLTLLLVATSLFGQFKDLSNKKLKTLYSGDLVIIDLGYSKVFKKELSTIFKYFNKVSFSKEIPSGNVAVLEIKTFATALTEGIQVVCLRIKKGNEYIYVPMPAMVYAKDEAMGTKVTEGQIIIASRLLNAGVEWSLSNGKGYNLLTYLKKNSKENSLELSKYNEVYIREEDVLYTPRILSNTKTFSADLKDVSEINPKLKTISISELDEKILSQDKFAISYLVETRKGTFKLIIDAQTGSVLFSFKTEVSSYWDGFNKPALKALSKKLL
jgi:hypothetical protein